MSSHWAGPRTCGWPGRICRRCASHANANDVSGEPTNPFDDEHEHQDPADDDEQGSTDDGEQADDEQDHRPPPGLRLMPGTGGSLRPAPCALRPAPQAPPPRPPTYAPDMPQCIAEDVQAAAELRRIVPRLIQRRALQGEQSLSVLIAYTSAWSVYREMREAHRHDRCSSKNWRGRRSSG